MKLLQINSIANSGSTGRITEEIGQIAITKGWESYIAYGRWANDSKSNLIKIGNSIEKYEHGLKSIFFDRHGLGSIGGTKRFINQIKDLSPDLIHLHNIHGYYLNYRILFEFLSSLNVPVVWTLHDCWPFTGHCAHFQYSDCNKWKTGCFDCPNRKDYPTSFFVDNSKKNYIIKRDCFTSLRNLTLVPVCDWLKDLLYDSFLSKYDCQVIENGISTDVFKPIEKNIKDKYNIQGRKVVLGVASVWNSLKGFDDFIKLRSMLDNSISMVIVGVNDKQLKQLPAGVIGIKKTENTEELASIYSMADVFVNPTYYDTFPTVNIEALSCGTPVVSYNTGGCRDIVDEKTGIIVEPGNLNGMVVGINKLLHLDSRDIEIGCRTRALNKFNKYDRFDDYFKLYDNLLK